ncbi:hypothetical protein V1J52_20360 [Streptomyces sp. TRM 70351]|uniref:hypothetical protein n=1 Tax=Streptomyces sp. TRM 70351 TaxID=3116552 RepID=UPI002E7B1A04|nr:hypothetical protein [Streptomyces sp. TRM 70351]MEE1930510.1 hypothetical protein [Streptomyces sp. TRM 70351]
MSPSPTTEAPAGITGQLPPGLRIEHHRGEQVAADPAPWARAYEDVYAHAIELSDHCDPPIAERLCRHARRPGFALVAAVHDGADGTAGGAGAVAGYLYGYTLPTDTLWWEGLTPSPDPEFVREYPGRTVGVCELLVAPAWRRSHVGATLFQHFLARRTEERAAALIADGNTVVLGRYAAYGFEQAGTVEPYPGWRPHTMVVGTLDRLRRR